MSNSLGGRSDKLLQYSVDLMTDEVKLNKLLDEVVDRLWQYLKDANKEILIQKILIKLVHELAEHGEPAKNQEEIDFTTEQEYLDLIGRRLMKRYIATEKN